MNIGFQRLLSGALNRLFPPRHKWALLLAGDLSSEDEQEFRARFAFYMPGWQLRRWSPGRPAAGEATARAAMLRNVPVLYLEADAMDPPPRPLAGNPRYWLSPEENCLEAWEWHGLVAQFSPSRTDPASAKQRFEAFAADRKLHDLGKCYVFGTGPSLADAGGRDWSDGARIVCNTIVRDPELWAKIDPHVILAADAGYHFSFTRHAMAFRADLARRLRETETLFLYPSAFDAVVRRELAEHEDRLVPVPAGPPGVANFDLRERFELPYLHNVLPRLLAVACTLARDVCLWGFDGRAPESRGFWANSPQHSYPEFMHELRQAYPAFYREHVPSADRALYARVAMGDELESFLAEGERRGYRFTMMHDSWTPALKKRRAGA